MGECSRINHQPDAKEKKNWSKIWEQKEYNRKAEWINNMKKELQGLEEGVHLVLLRVTLKKYRIGKFQAMMAYMDSGFKKITFIHERQALQMSRCLEQINIPKRMIR